MTTLTKLHFHKLKRLENVTIDFPEKGLIALMGENGTGKTTVLHALACLYKPHQHLQISRGDHGNWWTDWFVPHTGNFWNDSKLRAYFSSTTAGVEYRKGERWSPRKQERRERYSRYIGFQDCMPHIEQERLRSRFEFALEDLDLSDAKRAQYLEAARAILNRNYVRIQRATKRYGLGKFLFVTTAHGNPPVESSYASHYMGAGEQKVLKIIEEIIRAPNNAILLFEEFEIAIHESALRRLIPWMCGQAESRNLQIIVSTHWPRITEFADEVHLRTLHNTAAGEIACINGFKPTTLHQLTGDLAQLRLISVWVEDALASRIVERIATDLRLLGNVKAKTFGAIDNAFSVAAALELDGAYPYRHLVVLDGDRYRKDNEKLQRFQMTLSGTGAQIDASRSNALRWVVQFNPVTADFASPIDPMKPERFLLDAAMRQYTAGHANPYVQQFFEFAAANVFSDPDKTLVFNIHRHFGISMERIELLLIDAANGDAAWWHFVQPVRDRLIEMAHALNLDVGGIA